MAKGHHIMMGKTLLRVDPTEKETDPRVVERLAPVMSELLEASTAPPHLCIGISTCARLMLIFHCLQPKTY